MATIFFRDRISKPSSTDCARDNIPQQTYRINGPGDQQRKVMIAKVVALIVPTTSKIPAKIIATVVKIVVKVVVMVANVVAKAVIMAAEVLSKIVDEAMVKAVAVATADEFPSLLFSYSPILLFSYSPIFLFYCPLFSYPPIITLSYYSISCFCFPIFLFLYSFHMGWV